MSAPRKASSVWTEMPFMRGEKGAQRLRELLPMLRTVRAQALERRRRVLAYDWAQKRLCEILGLSKAEKWNGYVPPKLDSEGGLNTTAERRALVELLKDVAEADEAGQ